MSAIGAAAVAGGFNILNTGAGILGQKQQFNYNQRLIDQQAAAQSKLNQESFNQNVQMWNMQNEYNSPVQQMARLQEAGLNPNLIYGSTDGGTASSPPQLTPATVGRADAPNYADSIKGNAALEAIQAYTQGLQMDNLSAQNDFIKARARKEAADAALTESFVPYSDTLAEQKVTQGAENIINTRARTSKLEIDYQLSAKTIDKIEEETNLIITKYYMARNDLNKQVEVQPYEIAIIKEELVFLQAKIANAIKDGILKDLTADKIKEQIKEVISSTRLNNASAFQKELNPLGFGNNLAGLGGKLTSAAAVAAIEIYKEQMAASSADRRVADQLLQDMYDGKIKNKLE